MRKVLTIALLALAPLLQGCGTMVFATSGLRPETAAKIHRIFEANKVFCTEGVASEQREVRVETYQTYDPLTERSISGRSHIEPQAETRHVIQCR